MVAITTHHDPLTLRGTPDAPVITGPNAAVAWSGSLSPEFRTDISFKTQIPFQSRGLVQTGWFENLKFSVPQLG